MQLLSNGLRCFCFSALLLAGWSGAAAEAIHFLDSHQRVNAPPGQSVPVIFELTNGTDATIKIQSADASCGCTSLEKSPAEIAAHAVGEFDWIYNSSDSTEDSTQSVFVQIADGPMLSGEFSSGGSHPLPATAPAAATPAHHPRGNYTHDPSTIIRCGNEYWFYSTGMGILSHHSPTLTNWVSGPRVFETLPEWVTNAVPNSRGIVWAPDIIQLGGKYYLYYAVSTLGKKISVIGLATNPTLDPKDPRYHWTDAGLVIGTKDSDDFNAIDPSVFHDADGTLWLAIGSYWTGIKLIQLNPATGLRLTPNSPIYPLAKRNAPNGDTSLEASCLTRHGKYYYLLVNWGACCRGVNSTYEIRIGRSEKITGPYLDRSGHDMMANGGDLFLGSEGRFIGPGHAGFLYENGLTWFSFHFYDGDHNGLASIAVRRLDWGTDGWPVLGALAP